MLKLLPTNQEKKEDKATLQTWDVWEGGGGGCLRGLRGCLSYSGCVAEAQPCLLGQAGM